MFGYFEGIVFTHLLLAATTGPDIFLIQFLNWSHDAKFLKYIKVTQKMSKVR